MKKNKLYKMCLIYPIFLIFIFKQDIKNNNNIIFFLRIIYHSRKDLMILMNKEERSITNFVRTIIFIY